MWRYAGTPPAGGTRKKGETPVGGNGKSGQARYVPVSYPRLIPILDEGSSMQYPWGGVTPPIPCNARQRQVAGYASPPRETHTLPLIRPREEGVLISLPRAAYMSHDTHWREIWVPPETPWPNTGEGPEGQKPSKCGYVR